MKIALCLHGLFNSLTDSSSKGIDGYNHIKKNILSKGDVDVFIHTCDSDIEKILDLYKPISYIHESQIDFSNIIVERGLDKLQRMPRPPQNVFSHLYGVSKSIELSLSGDYDVIIKSRFDLGRINRNSSGPHNPIHPYPVQCINFDSNIQSNKLYMANWNHFNMGPADMWFYGDKNIMSNFSKLYENYLEDSFVDGDFHKFATKIENNSGDISNAIAYYKYWMIKKNIWNKRINLETKWE